MYIYIYIYTHIHTYVAAIAATAATAAMAATAAKVSRQPGKIHMGILTINLPTLISDEKQKQET